MSGHDIYQAISSDGSLLIDGGGVADFRVAASANFGQFVPVGLSAADTAAYINALGAAGTTALLVNGAVYQIDAPVDADIVAPNGGVATLRWTGPVGVSSSITNAMVLAQGALDPGTMNTVPTNVAAGGVDYYPPGTDAISVAAVGTLAAGDWIFYSGHNDVAFQEYLSSPGVALVWADMVQVESIAALTLLLEHHTVSYHTITNGGVATPITIQAVEPAQNRRFEGIIFDGGNVAVGVLLDFAFNWSIRRCEFKNFALAGYYTRFSRRGLETDCIMGGGLNSFCRHEASHLGTVRNRTSRDNVDRYCAIGRGYGATSFINDCAGWKLYDNEIEHFSIGLNCSGVRDLTCVDNYYRDLDVVEYDIRDAADPGNPYALFGGVIGIGVTFGIITLSVACFANGLTDIGTRIVDARSLAPAGLDGDDCSYYWHDIFSCQIQGLCIWNKGKSNGQIINGATRAMTGLRVQDSEGNVVGYHAQGVEYALRINSGLNTRFSHCSLQPYPSNGPIPVIGVFIESGLEIIELDDVQTWTSYFGPVFGALDYTQVTARKYRVNDWLFEGPCWVGQNLTGGIRAGGEVVALDNASAGYARGLVATNAVGASTRVCRFVSMQGPSVSVGGYSFFDLVPGAGGRFVVVTADAVVLGVPLNVVGGGAFNVSPLGAGAFVGTALTTKAAAVAGGVIGGS